MWMGQPVYSPMLSVVVCLILLVAPQADVPPDSVAILDAHRLSSEFDFEGAERVLLERIRLKVEAGRADNLTSLLYFELGKVYHDQGRLLRAMEAFQTSFRIDTELADQGGLAVLHQRIGLVLMDMGHYKRAFDHFMESKRIAESRNDSLLLSYNAHNIGVIYEHLENYERAAHFYLQSLEMDSLRNDRHGYAIGLLNMANIRAIRGDTAGAMSDYQRVMQMADALQDPVLRSDALGNIAHLHHTAGRHRRALQVYREALRQSRTNRNDLNTAFLLVRIAEVHLAGGDFRLAGASALEAVTLARSTHARPTLMNGLDLLAKARAGMGRYEEAYRHLSESTALRDSIHSSIDIQQFVQAELQDAFDRQNRLQTKLDAAEQSRYRAWLIGGGLTLAVLVGGLVISVILYRRNRNLYASLRRAEQSRSALFSIMAHDIKNPLTGIIGLSGIIVDDARDMSREDIWSFAHRMNKSAQNLNRLLDNLLEWSRVELDMKRFVPTPIHPYEAVHKVWNLLEEIARPKNITLRNRIDPNAVFHWDPYILDSILRNLLSNAIKYSYRDGLVIVTHQTDETEHIVSIRDFGQGMSQETLNSILMEDDPISTPGTESEMGSGLGLLISKQVAQKNGARITFNGPLDGGTEVQIRIKAETPPPSTT